ncbi:serine/threonine protein kinase [Desulfolutivibrio sulfoxidireducens]|uniref:serine/threonine protein kinase n=1 Tax=Desulfolutivibrio sulfoxidireducens TaxID=2773299 RepID=UPI00159E8947|nr:serine/threonine protein kinase [Desulfolutivibrio sulfoxidireducens]QLA14650.1 protein kinase [Desulfolutivibrio sulfoxidireducens]QLA18231.1 protein kinase [Desulfolutivibrio sulfoxidireducens]
MENLEGYDIIEKIGEGGMGQVYRAVHRRLDRPVAIKRLAPHLSQNQDMLKRFLQEARLQARLNHPNVVNIFDLIENDQGIFLVMEYVEGQTARDMLQGRGRLSVAEALMIAEGVLSGLAFMHKNGVVHRDIKPSNVMVSVAGTVKVTDFGIARLVNEETGLTRFGGGIGTLHYMAPELIKSGQVSFAIDIYSLGATLHELLAGKPPFVGNTDLEIMMGHLEKEPPSIDFLPADEAGKACQALIETALAKDPGDRFPSAEAFLAEVRRVREMFGAQKPRPDQTGPEAAPPRIEAGPTPSPPGAESPAEPGLSAAPVTPSRAKGVSGDDKATSPTPVPPLSTQAAPLARAAGPSSQAEKKPAPSAGTPKKGHLGLVAGLGAAVVLAVVVFLVLRPGPQPPGPAPTGTVSPAPDKVPAVSPPAETGPEAEPVVPAGPEASSPAAGPSPTPPVTPQAVPAAMTPDQTAPSGPSTPEAGAPPAADASAPGVPTEKAEEPASPPSSAETPAPAEVPAAPEPAPAVSPAPEAARVAEPAVQVPPEKREIYVGEDDARLREQPDTSSKILMTLDPGTRLVVLEDAGEWIKVSEPDGQIGYISAKLTALSPPAPSTTPKAPTRPAKPAPRRPAQKPAESDQPGWRIVK